MKKRKVINILIIIIALVALAFSFYFYYKLNKIENNSGVMMQKDLEDLLSKVGEHYLLPQGEEPTLATVSDPEVLKGQSFFLSSEKGDKVLIFTKARKAVLYRPSIDKIIEITTVDQKTTPPASTNGPIGNENF
ncbi:MAG: hypothetical protein WC603_02105 [Candidatus Paceibacterota bacterium]|jgi:hypothetical protein